MLTLWQWLVAWNFPLHQRVAEKSFAPAVTLLKPLKGIDDKTISCLRSWLEQDYPGDTQVLFGVASVEDPVCEPVRQLIAEFPERNARLVICGQALAVNAKVSTLIQIQRLAQHEVILVSDADVQVPPDLMTNLVAPLRDPGVGLVNCFYRLAEPKTLAMRWEAIGANADFWSQVLQGQSLQALDFALGAVMALRQRQLARMGGFESLGDYLADDFQLGNRIARAGGRIALCPVVVDCYSSPMNWREAWEHQLRWARTIRISKPMPYFLSILSNATLWPALWVMSQPAKWTLFAFATCLLVRIVTAQSLQKRLSPADGQAWFWWLVPVKDVLQFAIWASAFSGEDIAWRGQRYRLETDGRLVRVEVSDAPATSILLNT